jgi:hypothetical protein
MKEILFCFAMCACGGAPREAASSSATVGEPGSTCSELASACHARDHGSGITHECHAFFHGAGNTEEQCQAKRAECETACGLVSRTSDR